MSQMPTVKIKINHHTHFSHISASTTSKSTAGPFTATLSGVAVNCNITGELPENDPEMDETTRNYKAGLQGLVARGEKILGIVSPFDPPQELFGSPVHYNV